ncbi:MAG: right-handed parallel beta-helix repeat-containing protein [Anaerolineales bacterium]|nr:right-handed parallel beta-helix repeat-containing protein [Anaerolineales bacterium]
MKRLLNVLLIGIVMAGCASPQTVTDGAPSPATQAGPSGPAYYVRPDGGNNAQCTGLADAPYPGSGEGLPCAWDHPFRALPPGGTPRIAGGDTVIVAPGAYQMGFGAPGSDNCEEGGSFDCHMPPIPSGPDASHPTRILGAGWDSGCGSPPELWGSGRPWFIVNLVDASNVEVACFEITDHSPCVEAHTGELACNRDIPPYGDWASYGLHAEDSTNVVLRDLDIHGLASGGVHAARLTDWTVENVRIAGNGLVGWDGDLWDEGGDSNSGTLIFRHWVVEWNGCGESYPEGEPTGCWGQEAGGYGDGVGTNETGGDWIIEDSAFLHNTSDGLDLLYHTLGGSITLNRVRAEGNAGNQIKVTGETTITNSVIVGNCAFFDGQPFAYWVDHCRALGNALVIVFTGGEQVSIANSTLYGQGDGLVTGSPREGFQCNGDETILARNSVFLGDADFFDPSDITFLFYQEGCPNLKLDSDYNIVHNVKNVECGAAGDYTASGAHDYCGDPALEGPLSGVEFGMQPSSSSPAIDAGDNSLCPTVDSTGAPRPTDGNGDGNAVCDVGAYE